MASRISLALLAGAINTAVASAFATFLTFSVASAVTQQFGTAEEARAMLDRATAALKSDETKALRDFNDTKNKLFHDRDLYISCFTKRAEQPLRQRPRFQSDPLKAVGRIPHYLQQRIRLARNLSLPNDLARAIHNADARVLDRNSA